MKRNISLLLFATAAWLFVGCNNFLDKSPDSELNVDIDSEEKIAELQELIPRQAISPFWSLAPIMWKSVSTVFIRG